MRLWILIVGSLVASGLARAGDQMKPDADAIVELLQARARSFEGYSPARLGFAGACSVKRWGKHPLLVCRRAGSEEQVKRRLADLVAAFRAALPTGWELRETRDGVFLGPPGDGGAITVTTGIADGPEAHSLELTVVAREAPRPPPPPSGDPARDALEVRKHGFRLYSPAPLGFSASDRGVSVTLDDDLSCERRSGSKSEIKRAYRDLVDAFKKAIPKDWKVDEASDFFIARPPQARAAAVHISWVDRDPWTNLSFLRGVRRTGKTIGAATSASKTH